MLHRLFVALVLCLCASPALAGSLSVVVDISDQRMAVSIDGVTQYEWPVSTGRHGYATPTGFYHPTRMAAVYFSKKYDNAPMPHAVFFLGGFAIHGTNYVKRLGTPASHGCIRLHPTNAATLYGLVQRYGMGNTRIVVTQ